MKYRLLILFICLTGLFVSPSTSFSQVEQISFTRVESMPDMPSPYIMRDWKQVAQKYDSLAFDITLTGDHLPFVFIRQQGTNYPQNPSFGLDTYVGTFSNNNGEGINVLSALVGASLVGINKADQFGQNWILMSQDYFNNKNGENLYLNNIGGHSGFDWWYDMMPNIYFYQIYDQYGNVGDAENQFHAVADRMYGAVKAMGGGDTPWSRASMNYRAWDFINQIPNANGVIEPEAAGAYAWLLYNAYSQTGNTEYLKAAEWSMEFLVNLNNNPSYELQLPYGAYMAARMNAEIGTEYNVEKLLFWIFNRGPLRGWGTIVGNWNGFDVDGLVGEANDGGNDYAFQLNGTQQASALVPLVRYDKRFARTVGKYLVNVANATRLMFPGFLPSHLQDASAWSSVYDPHGAMGYEALREVWEGNRPLATGDALKGGWAETNLSLYSTSSIGYLGSILETTNVNGILKLDLLKTDFFHSTAYPSYLLYNPHPQEELVSLEVGSTAVDIYDVVSETFLVLNASGNVTLPVAADAAISVVLVPAGGMIQYENNKMLVNDVVVDYMQTLNAYNFPPRIQAFATPSLQIERNATATFYAKAIDQETKDLTYFFNFPNENIETLATSHSWTAPDQTGTYSVMLIVQDEALLRDTVEIEVEIVDEINIAPQIESLTSSSPYTEPGGTIQIHAVVTDSNQDPIQYAWSVNNGEIIGTGANVIWQSPSSEAIGVIQLQVNDGRGGVSNASIRLLAVDTTDQAESDLIAWYPFTGNGNDISGNDLHGNVQGPKLTPDKDGIPGQAYFFDGNNDHVQVSNESILNFQSGITVMGYVTPFTVGDKERFIISHGSWQNRWKISITPDNRFRWTMKSSTGAVVDLDADVVVNEDSTYHVACTYNGRFVMIYVNGVLSGFTPFTGLINQSPVELEIGQILPDDTGYSFHGDLDEIKIYDQALQPEEIKRESGFTTNIFDPRSAIDFKVYPNPSSDHIFIETPDLQNAHWSLFDSNGRNVGAGKTIDPIQRIHTGHLSNGIYWIVVKANEGVGVQKLIIQ